MSPRIEDVTASVGKQARLSPIKQTQIAALVEALETMASQISELDTEMKDSRDLGRKIKGQEEKKTEIITDEKEKVMDSLKVLHQGHITKFNGAIGKIVKFTEKKRELNEKEIAELREIYSVIFQFRISVRNLEELATNILNYIRTLARLLNVDEGDIIKEQSAEEQV